MYGKECNKTTIDAYIEDAYQALVHNRDQKFGTSVTVCLLHLIPILLKVILIKFIVFCVTS